MTMTDTYINPSREQSDALRQLDLDRPLIMVNLLKFNPDGVRAGALLNFPLYCRREVSR